MSRGHAIAMASFALCTWVSEARADDYDLSTDECAQPGATCQPESPTETLEADEDTGAVPDDPIAWTVDAGTVACAGGATLRDGACVPDGTLQPAESGGCAATAPGAALALAVVALVVLHRRRRALAALALAASCATDGGFGWDDLASEGPTGDARIDVFASAIGDGDGVQYLLAHQPLGAGTQQPTAQLALERTGDIPIVRVPTACGDRLVTETVDDGELLGWARATAGDGTAELVELASPDGCAHVYETDPAAIDALVADGYAITASLGHVWPPGLGDTVDDDETLAAPAPCHVTKRSPWFLLYASPGADESERFLTGCPGEVIIGEKGEGGPVGRMRQPANHDRGGRSAFVLDRNGDKLRELLGRPNGVERTAQYLRNKLAAGYDYIAVDEITAAADWADGRALNHAFRKLLLRLPPRVVIGYVSIDLTQYADGAAQLRARRYLMRALKRRGRGIALEVYLHTPQVMAGAAPNTFRTAADRLARATRGMKDGGGINLRATTILGTSMHSMFPQYRYLDQPRHDLASITRQVNAIRHGSKRLRQQHGVGFYFTKKSDMDPPSAYSYAALIDRLRRQTLRFR